jgi:Mn2+/Fe2+ NRAMP family transporter
VLSALGPLGSLFDSRRRNVINIGADLGGMAEATQLITGIRALIWIPVYACVIIGLLVWISYKLMAQIFKWMTLVLFAYVFASFYAHVDWRHALAVTFIPHLEWSRGFLAVLVAILGTTISSYLFFWQAAEEVEEGRTKGRGLADRRNATAADLRSARADTMVGDVFLEFHRVFHHSDYRCHVTCARSNGHHNRPAGRRSIASACR